MQKKKKESEDIDAKKEGENKEILNKLCSFSNELLKMNKDNKLAQEMVKITENKKKMNERRIMRRDKKTKEANWLKFKKMIREKSATKDSTYFKEKMTLEEQNALLNKMKEITELVKIDKPFRIGLYDLDIPNEFKAIALKKIDMLKYMDWGSGEYYKVKTWVDTFMRIPFNRLNTLSIKKEDGFDKCSEFMHNAKQQLDEVVYGLADAKMQVLQLIGQWITNPSAVGTAIAIKGPMGSGKTTLIKNGISKILGREFAFIALGGATDSAFLEGHSITYEGSTWGKIVDILIQCRSMNPIIYFDELDKISETPKGEEITGILTHLTDVTQNDKFHDKFFSEIDFDLSKCLFIFSYNDESKVNPILRDRMYRISTKGYDKKDKCKIANDYLLPKIREQLKFEKGDIIIDDSVLHYIIDNYTQNEDGVRNLKRCLEIIHTKVNLFTMLKPDTKLYEDDITLQITFPYTVTNEIVEKLIKKEQNTGSPFGMYL
ncbi:MAG: hypothetical protein CMF51_01450 [Legionellales bacterium]|nr:hypothetical protein [Legionellales bacterium]